MTKCQRENIVIQILSHVRKSKHCKQYENSIVNLNIYAILGSKVVNAKKCNMIDTNPESSFSESNSNSMLSKTPTSVHTLAGDVPKADSIDTNHHMDKMSLSIPPGCY